MKIELIYPPVLALIKVTEPFVVRSDTSKVQLGCVLPQEQEDKQLTLVGFWSCSLNIADRICNTTQEDCPRSIGGLLC